MRSFPKKLLVLTIVLFVSLTIFLSDALAWVSVQIKPQCVLANGQTKADIIATVKRGDGGSNKGLTVDFKVVYPDGSFGRVNPLYAVTDSAGQAKTMYYQPWHPTPSIVGIMASVTINVNGITQSYYGFGWVYVVFVKIYPSVKTVEDGKSAGPFEVVVLPHEVSATSRRWTWKSPPRAGNNPYCQFSTTTGESTTIQGLYQAKWFAYPDRPITSLKSTYTIDCAVVVEGVELKAINSKLFVEIPEKGGGTTCPTIKGEPNYVYDRAKRLWRVAGTGTLKRTDAKPDVKLGSNSQFYKKLDVHENKHAEDFNNGFDGHHFWTIEEFFSAVKKFTSPTEQGLKDAVKKALDHYKSQEFIEAYELEATLERRAYKLSDPIPPFYEYINGGRY